MATKVVTNVATKVTVKPDKTLTAKITATLREGIVKGEIAPGAKLSEPKLATQFSTSRGPIREAARRLETMGLVRHVAHEGVRVITLDHRQVLEIYHVREALEGKAAALAAKHMSASELTQLRALLEMHRQHQRDTGAYIPPEADIDFHYQIIQGSKNGVLIRQLCEDLYHLMRMYRYQSNRLHERASSALVEHEQLLYALEQGDAELAEFLMRHHIVRAREDIARKLGDFSL